MAESQLMRTWPAIVILAGTLTACSSSREATPANSTPAAAAAPALIEIPVGSGRPVSDRKGLGVSGRADWDAIVEAGQLRVLVARSRTHFEIVKNVQRGRTVDAATAFEAFLNQRIKPRHVSVELIVTPEDELIAALLDGKGEVAANLLLTFERDDQVAFAKPVHTGVRELVVTGPKEPTLASLEDVGGRAIHVRMSSDHHASLARLNEQLRAINRPPAKLVVVSDRQTDEDLLEMVNNGTISATLADDYVFDRWKKSFDKIIANRDVAVSQDGVLAWATRKDAPKLLAIINEFFSTHRLTF